MYERGYVCVCKLLVKPWQHIYRCVGKWSQKTMVTLSESLSPGGRHTGANKGDTYLFLRQTDETNVLQAHRTRQEKWNMLPPYSLMSQITSTWKLSPEILFVTLSVSLKWWWKGGGLHKSRKYEFTVWFFHFSVIHAPSLSYIHNVCTATLDNYIYYVYVHICTGHRRPVCLMSQQCPHLSTQNVAE